MFKTERIIKFKAKRAGKQNNNVNNNVDNKLLFQTQAYFASSKSQNNKELLQKMLLNPKFYPFRVYNYFTPAITGRWKFKEHIQFLEGLDKYGSNWKKICPLIKTRTPNQVRSHAQKFFLKLKQVKDEQLGIDFTSDNINSIRDMINNIKSINSDYDLILVFLYLSEKYVVMKKDKKTIKHKKELIIEIDNNSGSDKNTKNENNENIIINNSNQDIDISNDNNNIFNNNNNNISISNNNFMSNIFNQDYFNNNLFFMNYINNITNVNIYNNFSNNIMIQNIHLNNLTPIDNSIKNNNSNDFNNVEKNL